MFLSEADDAMTLPAPARRVVTGALALLSLAIVISVVFLSLGALFFYSRAPGEGSAHSHRGLVTMLVTSVGCAPVAAVAASALWRFGKHAVTGRERQPVSWWLAVPSALGVSLAVVSIVTLRLAVELSPGSVIRCFVVLAVAAVSCAVVLGNKLRAARVPQRGAPVENRAALH